MTHEFKEIITHYEIARQQGIPAVIATVVDVEGSSYRRPGVGMLILKNGITKGAVSGGCVEKEVLRQAQEVFDSGTPKMMTYDGKYRLGCEGLLYILIETFDIAQQHIVKIREQLKSRNSFEITSYYSKEVVIKDMGSRLRFDDGTHVSFSDKMVVEQYQYDRLEIFNRLMKPCFRLIIVGTEHDAQKLCLLASSTGWEVEVIGEPKNPKSQKDFPEANLVTNVMPESLEIKYVDDQTAVVLMTHNFAKDLLYLQALRNDTPIYIGLLGPARRREKLLSALIEYYPEVTEEFVNRIHGPAGLNLGAETPEEIAIAIIAEILSVIRNQTPIPLQDKKGAIHDDPDRKHINVVNSKT